jgi:ankyrin repeat protein
MKAAIIVLAAMLTVTETVAQSPTTQVAAARPDHMGTTGALLTAIRASDMTSVKDALVAGANVNGRSEEGDTPLMYAAVYSTAECVRTLLTAGADPNAVDQRGGTALMRAVRDIEKVRLLIEHGAKVDARSARGVTALMTAANRPGASNVVKLLLANKADPKTPDAVGIPPLMYATDFGDLDSVKALVAAGAEVDGGRGNGATPLYWASNGPVEVLAWLLEQKANPNGTRTSSERRTPLMEAAFFGFTANARALLDWGADVNAMSDRGTALIWAAGSDRATPEMIRLLLDRGADPNAVASRCERCIHEPRSEDGRPGLTALMLARQRGETEIVKMLLAAGATR